MIALLASVATLAPSLQTSAPCYLQRQPVKLTGAGFTPNADYNVTLDRASVGRGKVGPDGKLAGVLSSGKLSDGSAVSRHVIAVHDNRPVGAHAGFDVSPFVAAFTPSNGDPRTLLVRFAVAGIGVGRPAPARVWLHYVDPQRHVVKTISPGVTSGACGTLAHSAKLRLFPFKRVRAGRWTLQFDLHRPYISAAQPRIRRLVDVK